MGTLSPVSGWLALSFSCFPLPLSAVVPAWQLECQPSFLSLCDRLLRFVSSSSERPRREVVEQRRQRFRRSNVRAVARVNLKVPPALLSLRALSKLPKEIFQR
jgi:hypothetical protein